MSLGIMRSEVISDLEIGGELSRHRDILQSHVLRKAVLERRKILAAYEGSKVSARLGGDTESIAGNVVARQLLLDVGDLVQRRHADFPAVGLVGSANDRRHHRVVAREREL